MSDKEKERWPLLGVFALITYMSGLMEFLGIGIYGAVLSLFYNVADPNPQMDKVMPYVGTCVGIGALATLIYWANGPHDKWRSNLRWIVQTIVGQLKNVFEHIRFNRAEECQNICYRLTWIWVVGAAVFWGIEDRLFHASWVKSPWTIVGYLVVHSRVRLEVA